MSSRGWPDPRAWTGDAPFPWPPIPGLRSGDAHVACYTVLESAPGRDAHGDDVLDVEMADASGSIRGRLRVVEGADWIRPGLYVGVRATVIDAGGQPMLEITELSPLQVGLDDLALFLPHTSADTEILEDELGRLIGSISHPGLRALLELLLGADTETGRGFRLAPAATRHHHACLGGLFEHTVSVARLCDFAADHYGDSIDRDLLGAAALVHDIGKVREIGARAGFPYTDEGRLLGHILLGLRMVGEAARDVRLDPGSRLLLEHLVASHQGRYEWQSPREPLILEAFILHYIDDLDAKVDHARTVLDSVQAGWTDYDRSLRRELLRHSVPRPLSRVTLAPEPDPQPEAPVDRPVVADSQPAPAPATGTGRKRATRKAAGKTGQAKTKTKTKPRKKKATKRRAAGPTASRRSRDASATRDSARPPIIEPGMPGFVDTDTLDLFDQE